MFVKSAVITSDVIPIPVLAGTNESSRIRDDYKPVGDVIGSSIRTFVLNTLTLKCIRCVLLFNIN